MKSIITMVVAGISFGALANTSHADFQVVNNTNNTIQVALTWTFNEHLYSKGWCTLRPGQKKVFRAGDFTRSRTFYLAIQENGRLRTANAMTTRDYFVNTRKALIQRQGHSWQITNRFVSQQMAAGNFKPLTQHKGGLRQYSTIRFQPRRNWRGFEVEVVPNATKYRRWN